MIWGWGGEGHSRALRRLNQLSKLFTRRQKEFTTCYHEKIPWFSTPSCNSGRIEWVVEYIIPFISGIWYWLFLCIPTYTTNIIGFNPNLFQHWQEWKKHLKKKAAWRLSNSLGVMPSKEEDLFLNLLVGERQQDERGSNGFSCILWAQASSSVTSFKV